MTTPPPAPASASTPTSRLPRPTPCRSSTPTTIAGSGASSHRYAPTPPSSSSKQKPKSGSRSRSKSQLTHPKILPFPDLPLRAQVAAQKSRESSRAASPMSSPPIERLEVTFDQMVSMSRGPSSDGNHVASGGGSGSGSRISSGSATGTATPTSALNLTTSPTISSPLAITATSFNRNRAFTAPSSAGMSSPPEEPTNGSIAVAINTPSPASRSVPSPVPPALTSRSTGGFIPSSPALPRPGTSLPNPPTTSTTATPTPTRTHTLQARPNASLGPPILPTSTSTLSPAPTSNQAPSSAKQHIPQTAPTTQPITAEPTTAITPVPSSHALGNHLHHSFIKGFCADVRLIVSKWGVCYHVHKMILVQASFFHTLFLGGFSETAPISRGRKGKDKAKPEYMTDVPWSGEDVELHFDDPNITRAAFEICLSRLYSPYPHLHFLTALVPTASRPLTPSFPIIATPDFPSVESSVPPNTHLATPRLLLSLVATTTYLGQGALMREVLAMTLRTVGPTTIGRYLAFAVGDGIGEEEWPGQTEQGIKSLSDVAKPIQSDSSYPSSRPDDDEDLVEDALHPISHSPRHSTDSDTKVSVSDTFDPPRHGGVPIPSLKLPSRSNSVRSTMTDDPFSIASADERLLPHFYGVVGNKIGEACGCWMARWGVDVLSAELETPSPAYRIWAHRGLPPRFVRAALSSDFFFVKDEMERYRVARKILDLRRSGWDDEMEDGGDLSVVHGTAGTGMSHESAEDGWEEWEEEERELQKVFAEGIHYCHMTFDDLSTIASDVDPTTHLPYAPLAVLQAAHWTAADLRSRVTAHERAGGTTAQSSLDDENELGFMATTSAISSSTRQRRRPGHKSRVPSPAVPSGSWGTTTSSGIGIGLPSPSSSTFDMLPSLHSSAHATYHPVPYDETHRIGASGLLSMTSEGPPPTASSIVTSPSGIAIQGVPDFGPDLIDPVLLPEAANAKLRNRPPPHGEKTFFGLQGGRMTAAQIEEKWINEGGAFAMSGLGFGGLPSKGVKEDRWAKIEPYRFAVEFFDVDKLSEKERFYSTTHFYAGSYFNCYVQMIKRKEKGVQLGIYLHRQSPNEPFPAPSAPRSFASNTSTVAQSVSAGHPSLPVPLSAPSHARNLSTSPVMAGSPPGPDPLSLSTSLATSPTGARGGAGLTGTGSAPYIDTRSVTKAFFSISCPSALGTALIRFTSGPDCFALSQSWGWKSSALKSEEYLSPSPTAAGAGDGFEGGATGQEGAEDGVLGWTGEVPLSGTGASTGQSSLRATVVVGVV